ncbi:hypothetical protein F5Y12DRAFT_719040 [Xylaria sp. FL1777]|nr:hypothetical protein F5Y12DRAFT_719040 [Xylaria sp. FL1777]
MSVKTTTPLMDNTPVDQGASSTRCAKEGCNQWCVANSRFCKDQCLSAATNNPESSREIARWLLRTRRLAMYDLAEAIGGARERLRRPPRKEERGTLLEVAPEKIALLESHLHRARVG